MSYQKTLPNIKSKRETRKVNVKEDKTPNSTSVSCDLVSDKEGLKNILENIPSAVMVIEKPEGKVTYANKRTIELNGMNPCGLELENLAVKIYNLDGKICPTEELCTYRALFKEETVRNAPPLIIEHINGKRFIANVSAKPLYDKEGKATAAVAIFDDATDRVKIQEALKESEERLKMAQTIAHVGNWEYYVKEDRAIWSEELFRIFGLKPQEYGPNTNDYVARIHPQDREAINKIMEQMLFKGVTSKASFDYRIIREDGLIRTIHSERMIREVDNDKKPERIVGVEQDVTERKQIERKLEEHTKNLEKLVDERTKQLKDAERLATIGQTAGMIGHDIRNPLQAIVGELFLIKQDVDSSPDSQYKRNTQESLGTIQEQIDYVTRLFLTCKITQDLSNLNWLKLTFAMSFRSCFQQ